MKSPQSGSVGEPGWRRFAGRIHVTLDGREVRRLVAFDMRQRIVRVQREDREGRIYLEHGRVAEETKRGTVEVEWK